MSHAHEIICSDEAVARGLKLYFTNRPCKHGHISPRRLTGHCITCQAIINKKTMQRPEAKERHRLCEAARRAADPKRSREVARKSREKHVGKYRESNKRWAIANRAYIAEKGRAYRAENKAILSARFKAWQQQNPARQKLRCQEWCAKNRDYVRARSAEYRKNNPLIKRVSENKRRAQKRLSDGSHTAAQVAWLLVKQKGRCASCGTNIKRSFHEDHIMPLALGGSNDIKNIQLLCPDCNRRKSAKHPIKFAREIGRLL